LYNTYAYKLYDFRLKVSCYRSETNLSVLMLKFHESISICYLTLMLLERICLYQGAHVLE